MIIIYGIIITIEILFIYDDMVEFDEFYRHMMSTLTLFYSIKYTLCQIPSQILECKIDYN